MMTILVYRDGVLIEKMKAERLDVTKNTLHIDGVRIREDVPRDYFYAGQIAFQLIHDTLRIDLYEPDENGETEHHIRLTVYDW